MGGVAKYFGCKEMGCTREHVSRGYCRTHYQENKLKGLFTDGEWKKCKEPECGTIAYARKMCKLHYGRWRWKNPDKTRKDVNVGKVCTVEWCQEPADEKQMCMRHYTQMRKHNKIFKTCMDQKYFIENKEDENGKYSEIQLYDVNGDIRGIAKIDTEDLEKVLKFNWNVSTFGYARTNKGGHLTTMHRLILGLGSAQINSRKQEVVDHINHNTLDNRKMNLHIIYKEANTGRHRHKRRVIFSKYKGMWRSRVTFYGPFREKKEDAETDFLQLEEKWEKREKNGGRLLPSEVVG